MFRLARVVNFFWAIFPYSFPIILFSLCGYRYALFHNVFVFGREKCRSLVMNNLELKNVFILLPKS